MIHLADVHLDAPYGAFGEVAARRRDQVLKAFQRLPERAEEEDVHAVLVAGDLFDGPQPSAGTFAAVRETFRRLAEAGRHVFVVPGNHDAITLHPNPWGRDLGGAHLFHEPVFGKPVSLVTPAGPLHVHGFAYDPSVAAEPLETFRRDPSDGLHVVLLHGAVQDSPHWRTSPNTLRLLPEALAGLDADYVALGDYHRFRPPAEFDRAVSAACYPGSFAAHSFAETGPRGYVVVELESGSLSRISHRSSGVPPITDLGEVDVSGCESVEEAADAVAARVPEGAWPVARLVGTPAFPMKLDEVLAGLEARFEGVRLRDETRYYASSRLDELAEEDTIVGHVVRLGRARIAAAGGDEESLERSALRAALRALEVR